MQEEQVPPVASSAACTLLPLIDVTPGSARIQILDISNRRIIFVATRHQCAFESARLRIQPKEVKTAAKFLQRSGKIIPQRRACLSCRKALNLLQEVMAVPSLGWLPLRHLWARAHHSGQTCDANHCPKQA